MAKEKNVYICNECGGTSAKWLGKCPACGAWNTLIETVAEPAASTRNNRFASLAKTAEVATLGEIEASDFARTPTGQDELDRVLGGGMVEGGVVLIGGDPGIGKSTLLLQALDSLQRSGQKTLYVTGEESGAQVALRARRLGLDGSQVANFMKGDLIDRRSGIAQGLQRALKRTHDRFIESVKHAGLRNRHSVSRQGCRAAGDSACGQYLVGKNGVTDTAGQGAHGVQRGRQGYRASGGDPAGGTLESNDSIQGGGNPDRAAGVRSQADECRAGCD